MAGQRLQKILAAAGVASRRRAEELILAGRVAVNGEVVRELGTRAQPGRDLVTLDGRPVRAERRRVLALHKPRGVVTSVRDPHAQRVVIDLLGDQVPERVFPAGRLDRDSEGLVILTNDGALMQAMTRPGGPIDKEYEVTVRGVPPAARLRRLREGYELQGRRLLPCTIEPLELGSGTSRWRVVLHEGKKNQIRRMFRAVGHPVVRLVRVRVGPVTLGELPAGRYRELTARELEALERTTGVALR